MVAKKKMRGGGMAKMAAKKMRGGGVAAKKMRGGGMAKMASKKMMRGGMAKKKQYGMAKQNIGSIASVYKKRITRPGRHRKKPNKQYKVKSYWGQILGTGLA